jgi:hypothetical protein
VTEKEHRILPNISERMLEENRQAGYNHGYAVGYNEAVDDTVKAIKKLHAFTILEEEEIDEMSRQLKLKAGGNS